MNKTELIEAVATATKQPKTVVQKVIEATCDEKLAALKRGDQVRLPGFGVYSVKRRAAREVRNPSTGERMKVAESNAVRFSPSSLITEAVNRK